MEEQEIMLMKGNEAIAHAAIRCGCDGYFGYPITPQTEVMETLAMLKPWETTGMVLRLQVRQSPHIPSLMPEVRFASPSLYSFSILISSSNLLSPTASRPRWLQEES